MELYRGKKTATLLLVLVTGGCLLVIVTRGCFPGPLVLVTGGCFPAGPSETLDQVRDVGCHEFEIVKT